MWFFMHFSIIAIFSARFLQQEENAKATSSEHFLFQNLILPLNQETGKKQSAFDIHFESIT